MVSDVIKPPLVAIYRGYKQIDARRRRFSRWRTVRPFWGALLLVFGGFVAGYTPFVALQDFLLREGSAQIIGILGSFFAIAMIMSGVGAMINPELSNLLGMVGVTFSILSTLVGNFGGLLIGTVTGIVGGALCIAWRRTDRRPGRMARGHRAGEAPPGLQGEDAAEEDIEELREKAKRYEEMVEGEGTPEGEETPETEEDEDGGAEDRTRGRR